MNTRQLLRTAMVLGIATGAGLLGVEGTWALWNAATPAGAGVVRAADFRIELNGTPLATNGVGATVALADPAGELTPKTPVHAFVEVRNATDASAPFDVGVTLGRAVVSDASVRALGDALHVRTAMAGSAAGCAGADYAVPPGAVAVAKGEAAGFCIELSLAKDAPDSLANASAIVTVPITINQLP